MVDRNGGDLLVELMCEYDVRVAFGVASVHNLPLVAAADREGMFVPVRHEAAAVNAADAYSRVTGGLGIAITSTGTGAGNAAGSLVEAQSAGSRVLHLTGQIESAYLGQDRGMLHDTARQFDLLQAVSKAAFTVRTADSARRVLWTAAAEAIAQPQGPVSVEWPYELQYARQDLGTPAFRTVPNPPRPTEAALAEAARLIGAARRPLLWIGGGGRHARAELLEFAELLGAPVLTSNAGRGSIREDHELVIGNFAINPAARELITDADLLIGVGTHYRASETGNFSLPLPGHARADRRRLRARSDVTIRPPSAWPVRPPRPSPTCSTTSAGRNWPSSRAGRPGAPRYGTRCARTSVPRSARTPRSTTRSG